MDSGIARRPITDFEAYQETLGRFVYKTGMAMKPLFDRARADPKRVVYAEGEDHRVLRAAQVLVDDKVCRPALIGRPDVIRDVIKELGLRMTPGEDMELVDPDNNPYFDEYWPIYHERMQTLGV